MHVGVTSCLTEGALPLGDPLADLAEAKPRRLPEWDVSRRHVLTSASTSGCNLPPNGQAGNTYCPLDTNGVNVCHLAPGVYYGGWNVTRTSSVSNSTPACTSSPEAASAVRDIILHRGRLGEAPDRPQVLESQHLLTDGRAQLADDCPAQRQGTVTFTPRQAASRPRHGAATCGNRNPASVHGRGSCCGRTQWRQ